jgi:hypothetical protein
VAQVFRMASEGGAKTTPYGASLGRLEVGRGADMVLIDWNQVSFPYLDAEVPVLDAVLQRAKVEGVRAVLVAGDVVYQDGRFTRIDRDAVLRQISDMLKQPLNDDEQERRRLSKAVLPHMRAFYDGYYAPESHLPFYRQSSQV